MIPPANPEETNMKIRYAGNDSPHPKIKQYKNSPNTEPTIEMNKASQGLNNIPAEKIKIDPRFK